MPLTFVQNKKNNISCIILYVYLKIIFLLNSHRAQSIVWNASISKMVLIVLKSVPMACKVPTASSSSTQKTTMNAIPAIPTAPKGEYSQDEDWSEVLRSMLITPVGHFSNSFINQKSALSNYYRSMKPSGNHIQDNIKIQGTFSPIVNLDVVEGWWPILRKWIGW